MPTTTYIDTPAKPGEFTQVVQPSDLTALQPGPVAYKRVAPFSLATGVGRVKRKQGITSPALPHTEFMYCQSDRCHNDKDGNSETLADLRAKGHNCFRAIHDPSEEIDYAPGHVWLDYGNSGTNDDPQRYDFRPWNLMVDTLQELYNVLNSRIPTKSAEVKYIVGNSEYNYWEDDDWPAASRKNEPFFSPADNQTHTLQQLFDQGGINKLNEHLHVKRTQFDTLWLLIYKAKNPHCLVTNGDFIPYQHLDVNGDGLANTPRNFDLRNYKTTPYDKLKEYVGVFFKPVVGGTINFGDRTLTLAGVEGDYFDFLIHYNYYQAIYCRSSSYTDLMNTQDAAKNTIDYWHSQFWFFRHDVYETAATDELRRWFFDLHKAQGNKDFTGHRVVGMREHMVESKGVYITADNSSQTYPSGINYDAQGPTPFMKWIPAAAGTQRLQVHPQLIWIRVIQERMLYDGSFTWWEQAETATGFGNGFAFDYSVGRNQYFHQRSQEHQQAAWDHVRQDEDIFGTGSSLTREGIPIRYRKNNGGWSPWIASPSPLQALYNRNQANNREYLPFVLLRQKAGKFFYAFFFGQDDSDVTDLEFKHADNQIHPVTLTGCWPQTRTIRTNFTV